MILEHDEVSFKAQTVESLIVAMINGWVRHSLQSKGRGNYFVVAKYLDPIIFKHAQFSLTIPILIIFQAT